MFVASVSGLIQCPVISGSSYPALFGAPCTETALHPSEYLYLQLLKELRIESCHPYRNLCSWSSFHILFRLSKPFGLVSFVQPSAVEKTVHARPSQSLRVSLLCYVIAVRSFFLSVGYSDPKKQGRAYGLPKPIKTGLNHLMLLKKRVCFTAQNNSRRPLPCRIVVRRKYKACENGLLLFCLKEAR
ncbi:hypothetical protein KP509_1Z093300 [Ceratopteris richardii]|nr:hypothetical protein KP509_1Z093300 [Ceratopteris richardii]